MSLEFRRCCRAGALTPRYLHNTEGKGNPLILPSVSSPWKQAQPPPAGSKLLGQVCHKFKSEITQQGTNPKIKQSRDCPSTRFCHWFLPQMPITVAKPTKAALRKPWAQGLRQTLWLHCHRRLCPGHPQCSTPGLSVLCKSQRVLKSSWRRRRLFLWLPCGSQGCWLGAELWKVQRELNCPVYLMKLLKSCPYN